MSNKRWTRSFDDFFSAFGKSVHADVQLHEGEIVVSASTNLLNEALTLSSSDAIDKLNSTKSAGYESSDLRLTALPEERPNPSPVTGGSLPPHLVALIALQSSDGSWTFDDKFRFVIRDVANPPPAGISAKLWATAVVTTILKQSPEYFNQLESAYTKAMLHVDDDVLRLAKSNVDVSDLAMSKIRPYQNNEAREIREKLAREAAEKRAKEDAEEQRLALERKRAVFISKYSLFRARLLPMQVQELMISSYSYEVQTIYPDSTSRAKKSVQPIEVEIQAGDKVECCWRRTDGSRKPSRHKQWWPCLVTAFNLETKCVNLLFLDDPFERERNVRLKHVRMNEYEAKDRRLQAFDNLRRSWESPTRLRQELCRVENVAKQQRWRQPWEKRALPSQLKSTCHSHADLAAVSPAHYTPRRRLYVTPESLNGETRDLELERLHQDCVKAALVYDKHLNELQSTVKKATCGYARATLFQERFHAFDDFLDKAVSLIGKSIVVLQCIEAWVNHESTQRRIFVWRGENFIAALIQSLDFLSAHKEVVEWYGEDFAFSLNPFLRSESIRDLVKERGLQFTSKMKPLVRENPLRSALRMLKGDRSMSRSEDSQIPTWWPESRYDADLINRIEWAERNILSHLLVNNFIFAIGEKKREA